MKQKYKLIKVSAPPLPLWSSVQSFSDSPYQILYPGYQFSSKSDEFNIGVGACIRNNEENEPNNVSIVALVLGEACTLSNCC